MAQIWFIRNEEDGREIGPLSTAELKQRAASGAITPQTRLRRSDLPQWIPASAVKGLLAPEAVVPDAPGNPFEAPVQQPTAAVPRHRGSAGSHPPYRPAMLRAWFAIGTIGLFMISSLVVEWQSHAFLRSIADYQGEDFTEETLPPPIRSAQLTVFASVGILIAAWIGSAIAWCMWSYRVICNAPALGHGRLRHSAGWGAGSYFVPILNLFRPYQCLAQAWAVSSTARRAPSIALLLAWWIAWILFNVLTNFENRIKDANLFNASPISLMTTAAMLLSGGLAIGVAVQTTFGQHRRHEAIADGTLTIAPQTSRRQRR